MADLTYLLRTIADPKNLGSRLVVLKKNVARVYTYIYIYIVLFGLKEGKTTINEVLL